MEAILVVGKDPLSDVYGFNAVPNTTYGTLIPDRVNGPTGSYVDSIDMDESAGSVVMTLRSGTNDLGDTAGFTLESGESIDLTGVDGVYTAGTPSTTFTDIIVAKENGHQDMIIAQMTTHTSAETTDANTIVVTLDGAALEAELDILADWTVDIDAGTDNVVTAVDVDGLTVTITVTDAILVGEVVTVTHVNRTTSILAFAAQAVTNNEA